LPARSSSNHLRLRHLRNLASLAGAAGAAPRSISLHQFNGLSVVRRQLSITTITPHHAGVVVGMNGEVDGHQSPSLSSVRERQLMGARQITTAAALLDPPSRLRQFRTPSKNKTGFSTTKKWGSDAAP
jgi:hypothetical protein